MVVGVRVILASKNWFPVGFMENREALACCAAAQLLHGGIPSTQVRRANFTVFLARHAALAFLF